MRASHILAAVGALASSLPGRRWSRGQAAHGAVAIEVRRRNKLAMRGSEHEQTRRWLAAHAKRARKAARRLREAQR